MRHFRLLLVNSPYVILNYHTLSFFAYSILSYFGYLSSWELEIVTSMPLGRTMSQAKVKTVGKVENPTPQHSNLFSPQKTQFVHS